MKTTTVNQNVIRGVVAISGTFEKPWNALEATLLAEGYIASKTVTKGCVALLVGDKFSRDKIATAMENKIPFLRDPSNDFQRLLERLKTLTTDSKVDPNLFR